MSVGPNSILNCAASAICQHPCVPISLSLILSLSPVWSNSQDLCWTYRWFCLYLCIKKWKYFRKPASRERAWEPGSSTPLIHNKLCSDNLLKGGRIIWGVWWPRWIELMMGTNLIINSLESRLYLNGIEDIYQQEGCQVLEWFAWLFSYWMWWDSSNSTSQATLKIHSINAPKQ